MESSHTWQEGGYSANAPPTRSSYRTPIKPSGKDREGKYTPYQNDPPDHQSSRKQASRDTTEGRDHEEWETREPKYTARTTIGQYDREPSTYGNRPTVQYPTATGSEPSVHEGQPQRRQTFSGINRQSTGIEQGHFGREHTSEPSGTPKSTSQGWNQESWPEPQRGLKTITENQEEWDAQDPDAVSKWEWNQSASNTQWDAYRTGLMPQSRNNHETRSSHVPVLPTQGPANNQQRESSYIF